MGYEMPGSAIWIILALLLIFGGAYFTTRYLAKKSKGLARCRYIRVKDSMMVGRDKSIVILETAQKFYIVGMTNSSISLIGEVEEGELFPLANKEREPRDIRIAKRDEETAQERAGFFDKAKAFLKNMAAAPAQLNKARAELKARQGAEALPKEGPKPVMVKPVEKKQADNPSRPATDERDEIDKMLQSIHQRKGRFMKKSDRDDES